jgi:hypothetical protein
MPYKNYALVATIRLPEAKSALISIEHVALMPIAINRRTLR